MNIYNSPVTKIAFLGHRRQVYSSCFSPLFYLFFRSSLLEGYGEIGDAFWRYFQNPFVQILGSVVLFLALKARLMNRILHQQIEKRKHEGATKARVNFNELYMFVERNIKKNFSYDQEKDR